MSKKTHYRKVFKSDHLGIADLEDTLEENKNQKLIYTIERVVQEVEVMVAGRKGNYNIAYFKEGIKPLVLNATNSKAVKKFAGGSPFVEDWNNILIEVYIDPNVKMKGETVGGVRIRPVQPVKEKPVLTPGSKNWNNAKTAVKDNGATFKSISKHYSISQENFDLLCG